MATYKPLLPTAADKERGLTQGLLQLGQSLSASGGYSKMPTSFLSALGQGGAAFGQGYQSEIERAKKGQIQNLQYQQAQAQMQQTQMNIDAAKKQQAQNAQARMRAEQYYASLKGTPSGAVNEEGTDAGDYGVGAYVGGASTATPQPPSEFLTPLEEAAFNVDAVAAMKARIDAQVASDAAKLELAQKIKLKQTPGAQGGPTSRPASPIQISNKYDDVKAELGQEAADTWLRKFGNTATIDAGGNIVYRADAATQGSNNGPTIDKTLPPEKTPQAQANVASATGKVAANLKKIESAEKFGRAYSTFEVGINGVADAFANLDGGPVSGVLPAISAKAQKAQGAVSVMAPILKSLFRESGEGTFTDRDQETLLDMAPTRSDHPEVVKYKIDLIKKIVKAKLGMTAPGQSGGDVTTLPPVPPGFK